MTKVGPFGLRQGMTEVDFDEKLDEIAPFKYQTSNVPKPHSAFEYYILQITPQNGLSWIKAMGKTIATNSFGAQLQSEFALLEEKLSKAYGKPKRHDFLMTDSIWNEPRDWMHSLLEKDRVLMSEWSTKWKSTVPSPLDSIALLACTLDTSSGYLAVEYSYENAQKSDEEIAAMEDDAL